jgi:hypothetical protein
MQQCEGHAKCVETWRLADGLFVDGKVGDIFIWEVRGSIGELQRGDQGVAGALPQFRRSEFRAPGTLHASSLPPHAVCNFTSCTLDATRRRASGLQRRAVAALQQQLPALSGRCMQVQVQRQPSLTHAAWRA